MKINLDFNQNYIPETPKHALLKQGKMDKKEKLVRKTLVDVWTRLLNEYARPGVAIPSMDEVRRVLLQEGVHAATKAVKDKYWYLPKSKIKSEVERNVRAGLNTPELEIFMEEVKNAQKDPGLLPALRNHIRHYVLEGF